MLFPFFTLSAFSQSQLAKGNGTVTGIVQDSTLLVPVEFANVAILDKATGKPIDGTVCDDKGKFVINKLQKGEYIIAISFIGFDTKHMKLSINDKRSDVNLGIIQIASSSQMLQAVTIEGQKELVEEKVDRTIYNAENDQTAKGGDATDVLKRVPMLSVDMDGNVSLRGSANVKC